jgi:transcriptional regulator with XRE-family HTH domain
MSGFGEQLRRKRESHGATLEDIARATEVDIGYLRALEADEIETLPGPAFGKFYIRAYAEVLGFDPRSLIEAYDRAQRDAHKRPLAPPPPKRRRERWDESRSDPPATAPQHAATVAETPQKPESVLAAPTEKGTTATAESIDVAPTVWRRAMPAAVAVVAVVVLGYFAWTGWGGTAARKELEGRDLPQATAPERAPTPQQPLATPPEADAELRDTGAAEILAPPADVDETGLRVTEFGVGRRMSGRRLEERGSRFEEGTVVWFSTRIRGGRSGERIRHVWIHEKGVVQTIDLELGGSHWRTHSSKTLWGRGTWAVEARDAAGRVLARAEFTCGSAD